MVAELVKVFFAFESSVVGGVFVDLTSNSGKE